MVQPLLTIDAMTVGRSLFDQRARSDSTPIALGESQWEFIDRSARAEVAPVRALLNTWFAAYPEPHRGGLLGQLRSRAESQFRAAFWELYLHAALSASGLTAEVHPTVPNRTTRPDFLVQGPKGSFYLEARVTAPSQEEVAHRNRTGSIYEALNRLDSPNFFLYVQVEEPGTVSLNTRKLRPRLLEWLAGLDPDVVLEEMYDEDVSSPDPRPAGLSRLPRFPWVDNGWRIEFRAWPKGRLRGKAGVRPVGIPGGVQVGFVDDRSSLKHALEDKVTRYGELDFPYVIAILVSSHTIDQTDLADVIYGTSVTVVSADRSLVEFRRRDGVWAKEGAHAVAAVVTVTDLQPWTVGRLSPTFWHRAGAPSAVEPLSSWFIARLANDSISVEIEEPDLAPSELFQLPHNWP